MSYLLMRGTVVNVLDNPERVDKKTGEVLPAYKQVQLQVVEPLQNGQERFDIKTLTVTDLAPYAALRGQEALVEVGVYAKGAPVAFYAKKGTKPHPVVAKRPADAVGGASVRGTGGPAPSGAA